VEGNIVANRTGIGTVELCSELEFMSALQRIMRATRIRSARAFPARLRHISIPAPIATVTFDDFARSAWTTGGKIVEDAGARATYYVSGSHCGHNIDGIDYFTEADLAEAHSRGHEAGCHTFSHLPIPSARKDQIECDLARNAAFIRNITGQQTITSFAYPFGAASVRSKLLVGRHFSASRGIEPGINSGWVDFSQLRAVCLEPHILRDFPIARLVDEVRARKGWLIFITHDVSPKPTPYGCTPELLRQAVEALQRAGVKLCTVEEALNEMGFKRTVAPDARV
jgi:peptidoglycan/xylan/chitin deacetylase (PgdA/CDA1 family)